MRTNIGISNTSNGLEVMSPLYAVNDRSGRPARYMPPLLTAGALFSHTGERLVWYENPSGVVIRPDNTKDKHRLSGHYGRRREGRWTPIRAKAQDTRAYSNSWETHLVRKR